MKPTSLTEHKAAQNELRQRRAEIQVLRGERQEPVAIVGMACRFPGGCETPQAFWRLLRDGRGAMSDVPADRWDIEHYYDPEPAAPGKMAVRRAGFIEQVDRFDAAFFGISPREAELLDPQQRLLLEVSWQALENAHLSPDRWRASPTGVYIGLTCFDHAIRMAAAGEQSSAYTGTGSALNMAAGRLSFVLGFTGPSMAVDSACSSSLVCLHLACESLRSRETRMALVGGANLMLSPDVMVGFSQARMLSPDGLCKSFDAAADGYARGEGCGVVVLKRLSDAVEDGDPIAGVIRGTAVDHGGSGGGLTVPSETSQERVIRRALDRAQINPLEVSYVEAHGTGTSLGDPIEIAALASVYGEKRDSTEPLLVGSVKTNIGHLESAAGIAGLIKLLLSFQHQAIPASLHFARPNPHIPWSSIPVRVAGATAPWPAGSQKRIAGLSAFGFSGTNAHVVVEEPPATSTEASAFSGVHRNLLLVSAKSTEALRQLTSSYDELLEQAPLPAYSAALTCAAATGRSHFPWRQARVLPSERTFQGQVDSTRPFRMAFVFNGRAASCARELYKTEAAFREAFTACQASVEDLDSEVGKFATAYAWAELWRSWGVRPYVVMGRGNGEYVAAVQAGVLSLEDALRLLVARFEPDLFQETLRTARLSEPAVRLISYKTGTEVSGVASTAEHWISLLRPPQKPTAAMRTLQV